MRNFLLMGALLLASCGPRPAADVEKVEISTEVGDFGMLVNAIEITVKNPRSIKGLTAADFDLVNNVPGGFLNPATGAAYEPYEDDGISVESPMGMLKLSVCESVAPTMVKYTAQSSPVPFGLTINLSPIDEHHTQSITELNIELPMMLRAMVGSKLSDGAKKLGEMIAKLPYGAM